MIAAVFLTFFANGPAVLLVGELACGVPWGFFVSRASRAIMLNRVLRLPDDPSPDQRCACIRLRDRTPQASRYIDNLRPDLLVRRKFPLRRCPVRIQSRDYSGTSEGIIHDTDPASDGFLYLQWSYRIPFALQWVLPPFLIAAIIFAPESPWWLVRKGRLSDAQSSVVRLGGSANSDPAKTIAMMVRTTELEAQTTAGASYIDCFKGTDLRRTM